METPSSTTRRVTRSQSVISASKSDNVSALQKIEESRQMGNKQQDRSALIDITNDSPIVGLAMGKLETPSSLMSKKRASFKNHTPGSGEALLRGQVKNLLEKVEEKAKISKISSVQGVVGPLEGKFLISPNGLLLAPTPANTPQTISNPSAVNSTGLDSILESQAENEVSPPQSEPNNDLMVTRSLLQDFSEKSEGVAYSSEGSSAVTYEGDQEIKSSAKTEANSSSIWSIQVNASSKDGNDTDEEEIENETENYFDEEKEVEEEDQDAGLVDELCDAISKINVNGNGLEAKFSGKRIKFVYNSEDELEGEEVAAAGASPGSGLRLQGWPTPKGKHIRFPEESIDD